MDFSVQSKDVWAINSSAKVLPRFEDQPSKGTPAKVLHALEEAKKKKLFSGKSGETHSFENVVFVGLGKQPEFKLRDLARLCGSSLPLLRRLGASSVAFDLNGLGAGAVYYAVSGLRDSAYRYEDYKKEKSPEPVEKILLASKEPDAPSVLRRCMVMADAACLARDLGNTPGNVATPEYVASEAQKVARQSGLKCTVFDEKQLKQKSFNALLAVGSGSVHPPRLVVLEYAGGSKKDKWAALVGKGITFDSGGISIKPSSDLDKMKFDKSGACSVLAAMSALKALGVKQNVVGILALAENLPSGSACRPGDVVTSFTGKTVEILNTDAEGRLVLADALGYAYKQYSPSFAVDVATLTGACVVALGEKFAGLLGNNDELMDALHTAGEESGDRVWMLPLNEFEDDVKGEVAEIKNVGHPKGYGGASTAAAFLKNFVSGPWAHVDIAGTAYTSSAKPSSAGGATGFGVRLLLKFLEAPSVEAKEPKK